MSELTNFPAQAIPFSRKTKKWRTQIMDWADSKTFFNYSLVRKSVVHKKINYDLLDGKLHMWDLELILNPEQLSGGFIPEKIQHYPIMNSKLNVLRGEESKRVFDYRVVVTNPNSISEIENNKKTELFERLQLVILDTSLSEDLFNQQLDQINQYYTYEWLDLREVRANALLNHYVKELNLPFMFNKGFSDAMAVGEEIYQIDIVGGEPVVERVDPLKIRIFKSGYSNRIEDADIVILEDYWSPGKVIDTYYDVLSQKDINYIEKLPNHIGLAAVDSMDNVDERFGFVNAAMIGEEMTSSEGFFFDPLGASDSVNNSLLPYDTLGNLRVLRVYWKSKRRIKKVKSYDYETGEEVFNFYPENYVLDTDMGEEEQILYINEAWEGVKIGSDIYINMRPRAVQYNRLSNPSRCHFGIIGSVYNLNDNRPFSLVDMMKPYSYLYDVIHARLNLLIAKNWGKIILLDLAKVPRGWSIEKWLFYAQKNNLAVIDSFKEGEYGRSTGVLAGGLNNASSGVIDADWGNNIQQYINLLEFIKGEMGEVAGITRQREGQISNRETVGGVERATLLSSHITEWLFITHDDVKKRVLEALVETAKITLKGRKKKFQYLLPESTSLIMEIDGDEFAESDYGLVVDNSNNLLELSLKLDMLVLAGILNLAINFSTAMKIYTSMSMSEKIRMIEKNEQEIMQRQQEAQLLELLALLQQALMTALMELAKMMQEDAINQRDNETRILVAEIAARAKNMSDGGMNDGIAEPMTEKDRLQLSELMREFDAKLKLDRDKLDFDRQKTKKDLELKLKLINKKPTSSK